MESQFKLNLRNIGLTNKDKIVLAVSGGIDSVTMLSLFIDAGFKNLIIAHFNHGVRKEADDDQLFVMELAKKYKLKFVSEKITPPKDGNLEEELRNARRKFLLGVVMENQAKYLSLAHNANDQAETLIFNLLRGAGPAGLSGMRQKENKIIRPLLNISRNEIESYVKKHKLSWHEDLTNIDTNYSRNYIRHEILTKFAKINPNFLESISRQATFHFELDQHLKNEAKIILQQEIRTDTLNRLDNPLKFEVFISMYEKARGNRKNFSFENFEALVHLISSNNGTKEIDLPGNIKAIRSYDRLEILPKKEDNISSKPKERKLLLGENTFGEWIITARKSSKETEGDFITVKSLTDVLIRNWHEGDRIEKKGITGTKKLQDLFTDAKIDKVKRKTWPIIVKNDEILWLPELAISRKLQSGNIKITARKVANEK